MPDSDIEEGKVDTGREYSFVLTLHEGKQDQTERRDSPSIGNAVLLKPTVAITALHCLPTARPSLWVRSAIARDVTVRVKHIYWVGRRPESFEFSEDADPEQYAPILRDNWADSIVILVLDREITAFEPAVGSVPQDRQYDFAVAARDSLENVSQPRIRYASFRSVERANGVVIGAATSVAAGRARASGAPAIAVTAPGDALTDKVYGVQITVAGDVPASKPIGSRVGILVLTDMLMQKINELGGSPGAGQTPPQVRKVRQEQEPGPQLVTPPQFFVRRRADGMRISGPQSLLFLPDARFFHAKSWALVDVRSQFGLLTSGGRIWTTRVSGTNDVDMQIVVAPYGETVSLRLHLGGSTPYGSCWLHGVVLYRGRQLHVYLLRAPDAERPYPGRIRLMVIDTEGAYSNHRPEFHEIEFVFPTQSPPIPAAMAESMKFNRKFLLVDGEEPVLSKSLVDNDPVQDEVANGHEGHNTP